MSSSAKPLSPVTPEAFRKACSRFATGIAVATVIGRCGTPLGLTVNSFTSVSSEPPLVLICVDYRCSILADFRASSFFAVNVLDERQRELSVRFSQPHFDRFDGLLWRPGAHGAPLLDGVLATMECCVTQTVEAGDHAIFLAEVMEARQREGDPLLYFSSGYRLLR